MKRGIEFWKCSQAMGMVIAVMGIYSDVCDDCDYGHDAFDDGKFNYRGHGGDGRGDVMVMADISC